MTAQFPACQGQRWDPCASVKEATWTAGDISRAELAAVPQSTSQVQAASQISRDPGTLNEQSIPVKRVARKSGGLEWPSLPSRQEIAAATGADSEALQPSQSPDTAVGAILLHIICPHERLNSPKANSFPFVNSFHMEELTSITCPQHFIWT